MNQSRVKELFEYRDGALFWRADRGRAKAGSEAGYINSKGYRAIGVDGELYKAHRLVFLYHHGYFPENGIDHEDRDKLNNYPENLREVSRSCNLRNTGNSARNTSGVKGVRWYKRTGKWLVGITLNGKNRHLGYHEDFTEAVCHRLAAEQCLNWEGCDSSSPAKKYLEK